jgi:hypothetical protein
MGHNWREPPGGRYVIRCAFGEWTAAYDKHVLSLDYPERRLFTLRCLQNFQLYPNNQRLSGRLGAKGERRSVELNTAGLHLLTRISTRIDVSLQNTLALAIIGFLAKGGYPGQEHPNLWQFYRKKS